MTHNAMAIMQKVAKSKTITRYFEPKKYVYSIDGLAILLGCERDKAQEIKDSGIIDEAIYETGSIIVIDSERVIEIFKQKEQ